MHNQAGFDKWKRNFLVTLHHAGLVQACESHYDATILPSDTFEIETSSLNGHKRAFAKRDLARGDEIITENVLVWSIEQLYWIRCDPEVQAWLASLRLPVMDQGMFDELYPPKTWLPRLLHILNSNATTDKDYKDEKLQNRWKKAWMSSEKRKHKNCRKLMNLLSSNSTTSLCQFDPNPIALYSPEDISSEDEETASSSASQSAAGTNPADSALRNDLPGWWSIEITFHPISAHMEHSCRPNAIYIDNDRTKFRTITAAKDIEKGEPITIPYYDASICDSTRRQELGVARLGVSCPCSLCTAAAISGEAFNAVGNSDHWRRCMQRLLEFIDVLHDLWSDAVAADPQGPWDFDIGCDAVSDGKNDTHWQLCADQTTRELILLINDGSLPKGEAHSIPLCQRVPASGLISLAGLVRRAAVVVILLAQNEGIVDGVTYYAAKKLKDYAIFWNNEARTRHKYGDATMIGGIYFARALIRLFEAFFAADPNLKELRQYVLDAEEVLGDMGLDIRHNGCFGVEQIFAAEQGLTWKEGEWGTIGTKGIINASDARIWDRLVPWEDLR